MVVSAAGVAWLLVVVAYLVYVLLLLSNEPYSDADPGTLVRALENFPPLLVVTLGLFILRSQPRNKAGWWFMVGGVGLLLAGLASELAAYGARNWGQTGITLVAGWVPRWIWLPAQISIPFILMYYPNGRLPTRRWRPVLAYFWAVVVIALSVYAFSPQPAFPEFIGWITALHLANPLGIEALSSASSQPVAYFYLNVLILSLNVVAVASLVVRYRTAAPVERLQIKAVGLLATVSALGLVGLQLIEIDSTTTVILNIILTLLAVGTFGAAIMRYRLFDIDRLISRTISYSVVVVILAMVYSGLVAAVTNLIPSQDSLAVAGTTLTVAALFNPVRKRVQRWVDKRFNRSRYNAEKVLDSFSGRLQSHVDVDLLTTDLVDAVAEALHPQFATVWVR